MKCTFCDLGENFHHRIISLLIIQKCKVEDLKICVKNISSSTVNFYFEAVCRELSPQETVDEEDLGDEVDDVDDLADDEPGAVHAVPPLVVVEVLPDGDGVLVPDILAGHRGDDSW